MFKAWLRDLPTEILPYAVQEEIATRCWGMDSRITTEILPKAVQDKIATQCQRLGRKIDREDVRAFSDGELALRMPSSHVLEVQHSWLDTWGSPAYPTSRTREGSGRCYGHPERGKRMETGIYRAVDR